jgi:hypothetical protein
MPLELLSPVKWLWCEHMVTKRIPHASVLAGQSGKFIFKGWTIHRPLYGGIKFRFLKNPTGRVMQLYN